MDTAYLMMFANFMGATVLGVLLRHTWAIVLLGALAPLVGAMWTYSKSNDTVETLLFASPFLVAMAVIHGVIALMGARFGRYLGQTVFASRRD